MKEKWNERFSGSAYAYGTKPNAFFVDILKQMEPGKILLPAEGEGRNAVFAAREGWVVDAVDFSREGKRKASMLAEKYQISINYEICDINQYKPHKATYDAVAVIFMHMPSDKRLAVHRTLVNALKTGGVLFLECFSKSQLGRTSGGPQNLDLLYSEADLRNDFSSLNILRLETAEVELSEGNLHQGSASVIRFVGRNL